MINKLKSTLKPIYSALFSNIKEKAGWEIPLSHIQFFPELTGSHIKSDHYVRFYTARTLCPKTLYFFGINKINKCYSHFQLMLTA